MKEKFNDYKFRAETMRMIEVENHIIAEYQAQGYRLTLRQLYYQHVARGLIENTEKSYNNIGIIINKGRLAGFIDWDSIEDRTRNLRGTSHWDSPADIIKSAYRTRWDDVQKFVSKDA